MSSAGKATGTEQAGAEPTDGTGPLNGSRAAVRAPVRMRDVAELAGVGIMTVSRVLNGSARVTDETSRRVNQAIETLQYKPNQLARALRGSGSHTIGVLVPYLYDPFFATCAHAIDTVAQRHGYSVLLTTTNGDALIELDAIRKMAQRQVDGLIVIPTQQGGEELRREVIGMPIVTLDRASPELTADNVQAANREAALLGTDHLLGHGHKRICFLGLSNAISTVVERHQGYEQAMRVAGLEPETCFQCSTQDVVTETLREMIARAEPPTAILTSNGLTTRYALKALNELRVEMPGQMALVGFDDVEFGDLLRPPLTALRQPVAEIGMAAAELLFERMLGGGEDAGPDARLGRQIVLPVELVVRGSCGCEATSPTGGVRAKASSC